ncbi:MAG: antibiotic biosynthesis monooxygenase [Deltaproteobacteria bacterium HGW-Deltaproteobacteria-19]|jgi:heme-degrading monooxygenase HmoA|nr:MAG: antibiotic biosynthesis monooxygenase [Deltaproteobacteria bacterium HGW-Deltaproteobacteria-19]
MSLKVLIKRKVPPAMRDEIMNLIKELRSRATVQTGYITGETLQRLDEPDEFLVISSWQNLDDWNKWMNSAIRTEIRQRIEILAGAKESYEVYYHPGPASATLSGFKGWEGG